MSWALDWLQLPHDADERTIKRAYAARLKTTRPDTDPHAFQQLHEAYQTALAWSRHREAFASFEDADEDAGDRSDAPASPQDDTPDGAYRTVLSLDELLAATGTPSTALPSRDTDSADPRDADEHDARGSNTSSRPTHVEPPPLPHAEPAADIDIDALCAAIIEQACVSNERNLVAWLHQRPELWSLEVKPRVGAYLIATLHEQAPPIRPEAFDSLLGFFGLDQVNSDQDAYALQVLGERMQLAWEQLPGREDALARRVTTATGVALDGRQVERMLAVLRRPCNLFILLCRCLMPTDPTRFRALLQTLGYGWQPLADDIDRKQAVFWSQVGNRQRMTRQRVAMCLFRCAVYALPLAVVVTRYGEVRGEPGMGLAASWSYVFAWAASLWAGWVSLVAYLRWQGAPEAEVTFAPAVRLLWVPILAVLALITLHVLGARDPGTLLAVAAALTALARFVRRRPGTTRFHGGVIAGALLFLKSGMSAVPAGEFAVASALFLWTIDLWRHRRHVRWRR